LQGNVEFFVTLQLVPRTRCSAGWDEVAYSNPTGMPWEYAVSANTQLSISNGNTYLTPATHDVFYSLGRHKKTTLTKIPVLLRHCLAIADYTTPRPLFTCMLFCKSVFVPLPSNDRFHLSNYSSICHHVKLSYLTETQNDVGHCVLEAHTVTHYESLWKAINIAIAFNLVQSRWALCASMKSDTLLPTLQAHARRADLETLTRSKQTCSRRPGCRALQLFFKEIEVWVFFNSEI
jgi:hypothetical protein